MKKYIITAVVVVVLCICFFSLKSSYNNMVEKQQEVDRAWSQVDVQLQRRLDLIPNIVETVKGYAAHESNTYENVTRARAGLTDAYNEARALDSATPEDAAAFDNYTAAQEKLNSAFSIYVNAVHEAYPDLKADAQFTNLQTILEGTENRIATERGRYNNVATDYNVTVRRFPANIVAGMFGFSPRPLYKADAAASTAPKVQF